VGRAPPVGAEEGADTDEPGVDGFTEPEDDGGAVTEEAGTEAEVEIALVVTLVIETVVEVETVLDTDTEVDLAEVEEPEALPELLELGFRQSVGPPPAIVKVAEFWGAPVWSRMKSCTFWPTGSLTSQVREVFETDPKLTRMLEGSSPSTRVMK